VIGDELFLGLNAGSAGTFNISGGQLSFNAEGTSIYVGLNGNGTFNQTGGTVVGPSDGMTIGGTSTTSAGTYNLSAGSLSLPNALIVGWLSGTGTFNQSGGTNTVTGVDATPALILGYQSPTVGNYNLSGGALLASGGLEYIGENGGATGTFTQTGGTNTISGGYDLAIAAFGGNGSYTLSGGTVYASGNVGGGGTTTFGAGGGTGSLNVNEFNGNSLLTIAGTLKVYPGSTLSLAYGEIQTGMLDLGGNYSAFNWYLGTLELTNTNVVLDSTVVGPTNPLGAALVITSLQTLIVDQSEQIGGVGLGSLTVNGTHIVEGTLTVNPDGALTVNSNGSLSYGAFIQLRTGHAGGNRRRVERRDDYQ
jgi:hypothetical protein